VGRLIPQAPEVSYASPLDHCIGSGGCRSPGAVLVVPLARDTSAVTDAGGTVRIEQIDTAAYPEVRLFVSVLDDSGRPRGDLSSSDFSLTEDGTPVDVQDFGGAGAANMSAALVIDRSGSMDEGEKIEGAREAANAFIDMLRPTDRTALIAFNSDSRLIHAFSGDSDTLRQSVAAINPNGGTALYDAIVAGVDRLRDQQGRRVLLVLTDGQDCREPNSCPAGEGSDYSLSEAIAYADQARSAGVCGRAWRPSSWCRRRWDRRAGFWSGSPPRPVGAISMPLMQQSWQYSIATWPEMCSRSIC
jgi:Mg-chelatase subunit ChlD